WPLLRICSMPWNCPSPKTAPRRSKYWTGRRPSRSCWQTWGLSGGTARRRRSPPPQLLTATPSASRHCS
ncbi:hypothetical protein, partial [Arthrobacter sp. DR-2P]